MYRVSKEFSDTIMGDNRRFTVKVTCLGEEVPLSISKIVYSGGCNGSDTPTIGNTVSAYVEITAESTDIILENKELCLYIGLKLNGKVEYIPIGCFIVKTIENDNGKMTLTAYDRMIKLEGLYVTSLKNYSITSILSEISGQKGIDINIPESDIVLDKKPQGYTYREMIGYIASLLGKNALIDRNGQLVFKWYYNTEYIVNADRIFNIKKSDKAYKIQKTECSTDAEMVLRSGEGSRGISFSNPFMTQDILDNIYKEIEGMEFVPLSVSFLGDVTIDAGDIIKIYDRKDLYIVPVMNIEWEYDGGLISVAECVGNTDVEEEIDFKGPITKKVDNIFAELLRVDTFMAKTVTTETLVASVAQIDKLTSDDAIIHNIRATALTADTIKAAVADVGYLTAEKADLKYLTSQSADIKYANITLANIDTANINKSKIGMLFSEVGLITSANIVNGHVTGFLDSVEINANLITTGTLVAERLLLKGSESGLLYQLNNLGELTNTSLDTLNGKILTQRTVTADKLVAKSITANEIAAGTITADQLNVNNVSAAIANVITLNASKITSGTISADRIDINSLFAKHITSTGGISTTGTYAGNITFKNEISGGVFRTYVADEELARITPIKISDTERYFSILLNKATALSLGTGASEDTKAWYFMNNGGNPRGITQRHQFIESVYIEGSLSTRGSILAGNSNSNYGYKVKMWTDNEGGNIQITAPDAYNGRYYQFDAFNGNLRIYTGDNSSENTASMTLTSAGALSATGGFNGNAASASIVKLLRVEKNVSYQPGANRMVFEEFSHTSTNLPTANWYHVLTGQGSDPNYNTQLAIGMTTPAMHYRNRQNGIWNKWNTILDSTNYSSYAFPKTGGVLNGGITASGTIKTSGTNHIYGVDKTSMWNEEEVGKIETISKNGTYGYQIDAASDNILRLYCFKTNPWTYRCSFTFDSNGNFGTNTLNGYNIGGSVTKNNNGLITGGNVYNALGNIQIVEIMNTGILSTSAAVANAGTAVLSTSFEMWEGSTNYIAIPTSFRYCSIESISVSGSKLNITVRNTSGASHTLSASFQIIYYKYK